MILDLPKKIALNAVHGGYCACGDNKGIVAEDEFIGSFLCPKACCVFIGYSTNTISNIHNWTKYRTNPNELWQSCDTYHAIHRHFY